MDIDHDNPNMNDASHDYMEWWEGVRKEENAKAEKMDAEHRLEHMSMMDNFCLLYTSDAADE